MLISLDLHATWDPVAIYAALVATVALSWQMFTWWRSGPRLRGTATANMQGYGSFWDGQSTYVALRVVNFGIQQTTITHVAMASYARWWDACLARRPTQQMIVLNTQPQPIPFVIEPGKTFESLIAQNEELERLSRNTWLYATVYHAMDEKPLRLRIRPIQSTPTTPVGG